MKFTTIQVSGWEAAIHGMRNPLESWAKSDSDYGCYFDNNEPCNKDCYNDQCRGKRKNFIIGSNDLNLMQRLIKGGTEHRKFLRYIHVQFDMTAPLYIWKEFDTYKIGTTANSTSTMHKLASTPITLDCFEIDDYNESIHYELDGISYTYRNMNRVDYMIDYCENMRQMYLNTKDIRFWKELIRWLPESWLQTRTIDLNYEVLRTIVRQRKGHKLSEWKQFIDWVHTLPYADELIFYCNDTKGEIIENIMSKLRIEDSAVDGYRSLEDIEAILREVL